MDNSRVNILGKDWVSPYRKVAMQTLFGINCIFGFCAIIFAMGMMFKVIAPIMDMSIFLLPPLYTIMFVGFIFPFSTYIGYQGTKQGNFNKIRKCHCIMEGLVYISFVSSIYACVASHLCRGRQYFIETAIRDYHTSMSVADHIDNIQRTFKCCGVNRLEDWHYSSYFSCDKNNMYIERCSVPPSCCIKESVGVEQMCGRNALNASLWLNSPKEETYFMAGCQERIETLLQEVTRYIIIIFLFLVTWQMAVWIVTLALMIDFAKAWIRKKLGFSTVPIVLPDIIETSFRL